MASGFHIYCLQRIWDKLLSQVEEFKYLGVLFMSKGRVEHEIDVVTVPVCCGKDRAEHENEAVDLLVNLRSCPRLWS